MTQPQNNVLHASMLKSEWLKPYAIVVKCDAATTLAFAPSIH